MTSSITRRIRLLDRDAFAVIGQLPVGMGTRLPYLSSDGSALFASSSWAHYAWNPDTLVSGGASPRRSAP